MPRNKRPEIPRAGRFAAATSVAASGPPTRRAAAVPAGRSEVRIIGGEWRGRKLHFPSLAGLRPTPDRVRETVFNWLQFDLPGARCLDLFAGSGALGLEALSRGAAEVVLVEREAAAVRAIEETLARLRCDRGRVVHLDAFAYLGQAPGRPFEVVFLDPPYAGNLLAASVRQLETGGWLAPDALVYLEDAAAQGVPGLPPGWTVLRSKRAGEVGYHLARRSMLAHQEVKARGEV
jgi:16S rRNA (guanine966-N2)-methyltransferase